MNAIPTSTAWRHALRRGLACLALVLWVAMPAMAQPPAAALVLDAREAVPVWPAVRLLKDADSAFNVEQLADRPGRFEAATGTAGNLGKWQGTVWLRVPVQVPGTQDVRRVLEIDYPPLNQVDLYVLHQGRVLSHQRMGNQLPPEERALRTRSHAANLQLPPGDHELLLRVQTMSSVVLPITLRSHESFTRSESLVQLVQGIVLGLALCMLLYSLAHWVSLRDPVFLDYALLLAGNTVFSLSYFGIGGQYLWADWPMVSMHIAPMSIMLAVAAGTRFTRATLAVREISPAIDWVLRASGVVAMVGLATTLLGVLDYPKSQSLVTVLGILVTVVVLPVAAIRAWRGDRVAGYMFIGWAFYSCGAITLSSILRGWVEPTFWTQHIYPFSTMAEVAAWLAVLGQRVKNIHSHADRARLESETLRTMAHTDALTGLPNRRGLNDRLEAALTRVEPDKMLAVYLLDLDGFKPVNDRYGHDVGDALLVAVGQRLQAQLRGQDVVARLGGDEFVVLAADLAGEAAALAVGQKLLGAIKDPFDAAGQRCEVGITIGYALAPLDGHTADELLKRADAAMYAGKQGGRRCVQRGGRGMVDVAGLAG